MPARPGARGQPRGLEDLQVILASGKATMGSEGGCKRALLKLSGNALAGEGGRGIDEAGVGFIAREFAAGHAACPQLAIVVGGGNILRGAVFRPHGPARIRADHAGMIATMVNALVLQDALGAVAVPSAVYGAHAIGEVVRPFGEEACRAELEARRVLLLAGGTGSPLFTTDTAAALRAVQLGAELVLKATRVDGVYSADPELDPAAVLYERLSYEEVMARGLGVMDMCAVSLCREHAIPVRVFNYKVEGNIRRALQGEPIGTLVGS